MFVFELRDAVVILPTGTGGTVISRCDSAICDDMYLVRHVEDGKLVHKWYDADVLEEDDADVLEEDE